TSSIILSTFPMPRTNPSGSSMLPKGAGVASTRWFQSMLALPTASSRCAKRASPTKPGASYSVSSTFRQNKSYSSFRQHCAHISTRRARQNPKIVIRPCAMGVCGAADIGNPVHGPLDPENQADQFASDLLLPDFMFRPRIIKVKRLVLSTAREIAEE